MIDEIKNQYKKETKLLTRFILSSILVSILDLLSPYITKVVIDDIIPSKNKLLLLVASMTMAGVYVVRYFISRFSSSRGRLMGYKIKSNMRKKLINHILKQPKIFFDKREKGQLISKFTSDMENVSILMYRGLEDLIMSSLAIIGAFFFMINLNPLLTVVAFLPLPLGMSYAVKKNRILKKGYSDIRFAVGAYTGRIQDILKNMELIKVNGIEEKIKEKHNYKNNNILDTERENMFAVTELMSGVNLYAQLTQLLVIFLGGLMFIEGQTTLGILVSFLLFITRLRLALLRMMGLLDTYQKGTSGIKRYKEIMETQVVNPQGKIKFQGLQEKIEFKDVRFSYNGENEVLKGINLSIAKGEKLALVGNSGSGKTTLMNLIKKLYKPSNGNLKIDDRNINDYINRDYYNKLGVISQDSMILKGTLEENINLYEKGEILDALAKAELLEKYKLWGENSKVKLGDGGEKLSGGEKQRISLARLLKKDPDIILMDEATSAMDNILEEKIIKTLKKGWDEKTVVAIAHRLESIKNFDRIIFLENGRIVESGSFQELLTLKNRFYRMYMREIDDKEPFLI